MRIILDMVMNLLKISFYYNKKNFACQDGYNTQYNNGDCESKRYDRRNNDK